MPSAKINDITMYYEVSGKGEPVVFILGLGTELSQYRKITDQLALKYQVIAIDSRGAGRTSKPDSPYLIDMMANDIAGLLNKLQIEQANIVGISMGGRIALALALHHPKLVKRLLLTCTAAQGIKSWRITAYFMLSKLPVFHTPYPQPYYAFKRQRQAVSEEDYAPMLHQLSIPTVIMHGKLDRIVPFSHAADLLQGIKGSKLITFKGGHMSMFFRERKAYVKAIEDFIG